MTAAPTVATYPQAPCIGGPLDGDALPVTGRTPYYVIRHATRDGLVEFQYRLEEFIVADSRRLVWLHGDVADMRARVLAKLQESAP